MQNYLSRTWGERPFFSSQAEIQARRHVSVYLVSSICRAQGRFHSKVGEFVPET